MARLPIPLRRAEHRLPEQGLIKFGVKTERAMKAIPWFRFCSADKSAIEQLAAAYGGNVLPWKNGYGRDWWQVTTTTSEIRVVLPHNPLGEGTWYERWKGGGCERRCDGETCTVPRGMSGGPDPEPVELPCLCAAEGALSCKPHTRLKVMLPGLDPFVGFWRLEAKGDHAMRELPGMVGLVLEAQGRGMAFGVLRLEQRSEYGWNERLGKRELHHYVTPVVGVAASFDALLAGEAKARALGPAGPLALPVAPVRDTVEEAVEVEDDIEDAEIVTDSMSDWEDPDARDVDALVEDEKRTLRQRIAMDLGSDDIRHALARYVSGGRTDSTRELGLEELRRLAKGAKDIKAGRIRVAVVDGNAQMERVG